jgi:kynurenine formamidase
MALDTFWGAGTCLDISDLEPREYCDAARLDGALAQAQGELRPGDVLLLRTGAADRCGETRDYVSEYPGLDASAADWLHDQQVKIFGVDSPSPDNPIDKRYYENLANLGAVAGKRSTFFGFPLRTRGGHGSPVRAVAMVDDEREER